MRRDCTIDNNRVIAPNASLLGSGTNVVKAGKFFTYDDGHRTHLARSLGRVSAPALSDDIPAVKGYVLAMVLAEDATSAYERWVAPRSITRVIDVPTAFAAFFFADPIPYDAKTMQRLMDYGCVCERYVHKAAEQVGKWLDADRKELK